MNIFHFRFPCDGPYRTDNIFDENWSDDSFQDYSVTIDNLVERRPNIRNSSKKNWYLEWRPQFSSKPNFNTHENHEAHREKLLTCKNPKVSPWDLMQKPTNFLNKFATNKFHLRKEVRENRGFCDLSQQIITEFDYLTRKTPDIWQVLRSFLWVYGLAR